MMLLFSSFTCFLGMCVFLLLLFVLLLLKGYKSQVYYAFADAPITICHNIRYHSSATYENIIKLKSL